MPDFRNLTDRLTERGRLAEQESRFGDASDMQDARAEIERLTAALQKTAVRQHIRLVAGGLEAPNGESCLLCKAQCGYGEKLHHASGCLLASEQNALPNSDRTMIPQGGDQTKVSPDVLEALIAAFRDHAFANSDTLSFDAGDPKNVLIKGRVNLKAIAQAISERMMIARADDLQTVAIEWAHARLAVCASEINTPECHEAITRLGAAENALCELAGKIKP